jgi:peroxin-13
MATAGRPAPLKPWERNDTQAGSNGPSPFAPPSNSPSTAATVADAGVANAGAKDENGIPRSLATVDGTAGRQMPPRPWEVNSSGYGGGMTSYNRPSPYGGLGTSMGGYGSNYASPYGAGMYGSGYGSSYGGGYGSSSYGGGLGNSSYGGGLGNSSYGGMYNRYGSGGQYGGYGGMGYSGMGGGYGGGAFGGMGGAGSMTPYGYGGPGDPNDPNAGRPPGPPNLWQTMLHAVCIAFLFLLSIHVLQMEVTKAQMYLYMVANLLLN